MKSVQEIIEELNELKDSLRPASNHPRKPEDVLMRLIDCTIDLAKNQPHAASSEEVNEIFEQP